MIPPAATRNSEDWLQLLVLVGAALGVLGGWLGFLVRRILHWLDDHIASAVRELRDALVTEQREASSWRDLTAQQLGVVGDRLNRIDSAVEHLSARLDDHLTHHDRTTGDGR